MEINTKFRLKRERGFRCGGSIFSLSAGAIVKVIRADMKRNKLLIEFPGGDCDWFPRLIMSDFEHVAEVE